MTRRPARSEDLFKQIPGRQCGEPLLERQRVPIRAPEIAIMTGICCTGSQIKIYLTNSSKLEALRTNGKNMTPGRGKQEKRPVRRVTPGGLCAAVPQRAPFLQCRRRQPQSPPAVNEHEKLPGTTVHRYMCRYLLLPFMWTHHKCPAGACRALMGEPMNTEGEGSRACGDAANR